MVIVGGLHLHHTVGTKWKTHLKDSGEQSKWNFTQILNIEFQSEVFPLLKGCGFKRTAQSWKDNQFQKKKKNVFSGAQIFESQGLAGENK